MSRLISKHLLFPIMGYPPNLQCITQCIQEIIDPAVYQLNVHFLVTFGESVLPYCAMPSAEFIINLFCIILLGRVHHSYNML